MKDEAVKTAGNSMPRSLHRTGANLRIEDPDLIEGNSNLRQRKRHIEKPMFFSKESTVSIPSIDKLKKIPIFSRLPESELSTITKHTNFQKVNKDKILFNEGDAGDYICFVIDGRLDVIKTTFTNEDIIINTLSRGQSFGEMSIIESSPRSATVKATTETEMVCLSKKDFDLLLENHSDIGTKILKGISLLLSKKLRQTSSRLIGYMASKD